MPHKTPSFWYPQDIGAKTPLKARLMQPISCLYKAGFWLHQNFSREEKSPIPVICIGNLSAGGTGKTPTCISFASILIESGIAKNPYFLMRGYGGAERGPLRVEPDTHTAWDVGDESLILAQHAPTIISADRVLGAKFAASEGADIVIMDDGLQNPKIHKDIKIVVVNGEMGFGNGLMMPAGPLREPLSSGLKRADGFFIIGEDKKNSLSQLPKDKPVFHASLQADEASLPPKDQPYLAFAGLGYPEKFFNFLKDDLGYEIVETVAFADHCPYERADIKTLRAKAKERDAQLITTEKDYLRLPKGYKEDIFTLPVSMQFEDTKALETFLTKALA